MLLDLEGLLWHWSDCEMALDHSSPRQRPFIAMHCLDGVGYQCLVVIGMSYYFEAKKRFVDGPKISDIHGKVYLTRGMSDSLAEILDNLFESQRHLCPANISSKEMMRDWYQAFWT